MSATVNRLIAADVEQSPSVLLTNPAVQQERERLERCALAALRGWASMNPIERSFSFEMERAAQDLLLFEGRHRAREQPQEIAVKREPEKKEEREHLVGDDGGSHISWGDYPSTVV